MLDTVVMSDDYVCCSVVFGTVVGVFVFSVMWYELLMTSAISCPLWSSVIRGEWMREFGLGFTNPVGSWGVLDVCLCFGCGGVGGVDGEWVGGLDQCRERWGSVMSV